jgi:hypothetical protein
MSHELPPAANLQQLAHGRLSDFGLVVVSAAVYERDHNGLAIPPQPVDEGGVLHCINSGIELRGVAEQDRLALDSDGTLVRTRPFGHVAAYADFVGLWARARRGQGEAALYSTTATFATEVQTALPFRDTVAGILEAEPVELPRVHVSNRYGGVTNPTEDDRQWFGSGSYTGQPLLATDGTQLHQKPTGRRNDLANPPTQETDIHFSGLVKVELKSHTFLRLSDDRLEAAPPEATTVRLQLQPTTPQRQPDSRLIPQDGVLELADNGRVVHAAGSASEDAFNPRMLVRDMPNVLAEPLLWEDVTQTFLDRTRRKLLEVLAIDQDVAQQHLLRQARATLTGQLEGLPYRLAGCAAVAAALNSLVVTPTPPTQR